MKRIILLSIVCITALMSCDKDVVTKTVTDGTYKGSFIRHHPSIRYEAAEVSLTVNNNRFSGTSNINQYPAICSGTIKTNGAKLLVENECFFTANFDWTLIFKGEYEYELSGSSLKITRNYSPGFYDQYILQKQ